MKYGLVIILLLTQFGCATFKTNASRQAADFEVATLSRPGEQALPTIQELRFYEIKSALDSKKCLYRQFGRWHQKAASLHGSNLSRLIWDEVALIEGDTTRFTIHADGKETTTEFFTSFVVLDARGNDCLVATHPYRQRLTTYLSDLMRRNQEGYFDYWMLRE